jgi:hypothetical protein
VENESATRKNNHFYYDYNFVRCVYIAFIVALFLCLLLSCHHDVDKDDNDDDDDDDDDDGNGTDADDV